MTTTKGIRTDATIADPAKMAAATTVDPPIELESSATREARVSFTVAVLRPNMYPDRAISMAATAVRTR
jgi:hypothetical protein